MAFATRDHVLARLGRDAFTSQEQAMVDLLIEGSTAVIETAVERAEAEIDPVPSVLRFVAVEMVVRAMANPSGLASRSEALGAASRTDRFREGGAGGGLWLTQGEELMVRRAVLGQLSGTALQESVGSDVCVLSQVAPSSYGDGLMLDCEGS